MGVIHGTVEYVCHNPKHHQRNRDHCKRTIIIGVQKINLLPYEHLQGRTKQFEAAPTLVVSSWSLFYATLYVDIYPSSGYGFWIYEWPTVPVMKTYKGSQTYSHPSAHPCLPPTTWYSQSEPQMILGAQRCQQILSSLCILSYFPILCINPFPMRWAVGLAWLPWSRVV